jgi:POT family proton-dependent oligopeptide transporter
MTAAPSAITNSPRHPRGIYTLFFTEMWERMSFYGMNALLVLYMVDKVRGGMGLKDEQAVAIYGLYAALVYISALPGGWVGDRLLGARRSVWCGGVIIIAGHLVLGFDSTTTFFAGLILVALGSGLLKPNVSVMVAQLYPEGGTRRDAGFTLLYMGINVGCFIGQVLCSNLGEHLGWRWGFSAASVGMLLGLLQFRLTYRHVAHIGGWQPQPGQNVRRDWMLLVGGIGAVILVATLCLSGIMVFDPMKVARLTSGIIVGIAVLFFGWVFLFGQLSAPEAKRVVVIVIMFIAAVLFFAGFAQGASSFTLFAERYTIRAFGNWTIPAGMFQALNPIMCLAFSPVLVALWLALARRDAEPLLGTKFAAGLLLLGAGFAVAAFAATRSLANGPVWPSWLVAIYLLNTVAELCLSPVGLSAVTKLAPARLTSRMMGVWFLGTSLGYLLAGLLAGKVTGDAAAQMPMRFLEVFATVGFTGVVLLLCARWIQQLMPGVK